MKFQLRPICLRQTAFALPQILPDFSETAVEVDLPPRDAVDEWVSLMTDYSSVDDLEKAVSEARKHLEQSQLQLHSTQEAEAALQSQIASLAAEVELLRSRLPDLKDTHNQLMSQSVEQLETIGSWSSQLTTKPSNAATKQSIFLLRNLSVSTRTI